MSNATELQMLHWNDDRAPEIIAVNIVCLALLIVAVATRLYAQNLVTNPWKAWDTWLTIIATIFAIAISGTLIHLTEKGLGKHTLRVYMEDPQRPDNLAYIFMIGYVTTILQSACIMFTKLAILALYARVFGMLHHDKLFTWGVYFLTGFVLLLGVGSIIEFILQCIPAPVFWNRIYLLFPGKPADGPTEGYCMDQVLHVTIPIVLDLVSEILIMLLPSRILWNLQLPWKKKIGLMATFGLGIFVCATNIVRITYYAKMENGGDIAWDDIDAFVWTLVQMCIAIVAASIPPCAPLLKGCLGRTGKTTRQYGSDIPLSSSGGRSRWEKSRDLVSTKSLGISRTDEYRVDGESMENLRYPNDIEARSGRSSN